MRLPVSVSFPRSSYKTQKLNNNIRCTTEHLADSRMSFLSGTASFAPDILNLRVSLGKGFLKGANGCNHLHKCLQKSYRCAFLYLYAPQSYIASFLIARSWNLSSTIRMI